MLDFSGTITQDDIGFFIIPNGGGHTNPFDTTSPLHNPGLENGTKVVFENGSAYTVDENGNQVSQLKGQNDWNLRLDTDKGTAGEDFVKYGELDEQFGNQHWEDLPKDFDNGEWFDHNDVNVNVNWTMKSVVYNTYGDETLAGSSGSDLFVWDSSVLGGTDSIENFDCAMDKLLFNGLLAGDNNALSTLLNSGSWDNGIFTATGGGTTFNLNVEGDTATLQLTTTNGTTQTIEIGGEIQPFVDAASGSNPDTATAALLQQIISISG